jgi:hydroxyethylthiazole kinase
VGAGASRLRTETAQKLIEEINFAVIRGNISEIKTLSAGSGTTKGVDADVSDSVTDNNLEQAVAFARTFSKTTGAVIVITGAIDIVTDEQTTYNIRNGHPMMSRITGSGCMLTAMTAAYLAANPDHTLKATAASVCAMGLCGEIAYERLQRISGGNSSYRNYIIDEIYNLSAETLHKGAKFEIR